MNHRTTELAFSLLALGLEAGDRVGIYSPNCAEWTLVQMACARADLILVNVNPAFQADELNYCLNKVGVKLLVMARSFKKSDYVQILRNALEIDSFSTTFKSDKVPSLEHVVMLSETKVRGI